MQAKTTRRLFLREAAILLIIARLTIRFLPPKLFLAWAERPPKRVLRFSGYAVDWVSWAVDTAGAYPLIRAVCLPRALVTQTMLRRRGIASKLCLGVARKEAALVTHAWVEIGQNIIVGGAERHRFTKIAEFGSGAARDRESVS
jgi:hypothetical protein